MYCNRGTLTKDYEAQLLSALNITNTGKAVTERIQPTGKYKKMVRLIKALLAFLRGSQADVVQHSEQIAEQLAINVADFPSLDPLPAAGQVKIAALSAAISAPKGGTSKTSAKNELLQGVKNMMRAWAAQVSIDSNGDMTHFLKSGFTPNKTTHVPAHPLSIPVLDKIMDGTLSGSAILHAHSIDIPKSYQFRYTSIDPETAVPSDYTMLAPSGVKTQVNGLTHGKDYFFSVRVAGTNSVSEWSGNVKWMVR